MIPINPAPPNLPLAPTPYSNDWMNQFEKVLQLYFAQLNAAQSAIVSQVSTNQTLIWLGW
jgi:hypothetical protein